MNWSIKITKAENGYVAVSDKDITDNIIESESMVFQQKDEEDETNRDHVIDMFYWLLEYFAEQGSKHDKRRIEVGYRKGDKPTKEEQ